MPEASVFPFWTMDLWINLVWHLTKDPTNKSVNRFAPNLMAQVKVNFLSFYRQILSQIR